MPSQPGNDLDLGLLPGRNASLSFSRIERDKHLYVCGGTGTGKSKFLEHLIRQDIKQWHKTRCGLILFDPHGNLYDNLMEWMAWNEDALKVPIVPIDLRRDDWVVSYNLLRQRSQADPAVLVDNLTDAMAYVWGQTGTSQTPLFARWVGNVLRALYEKKLTLIDAEHLIDRVGKQARYALTHDLRNKPSRQDWEFADTLSAKDFETQIGSTVNRLRPFIGNELIRSMLGQPTVSMDLGNALEEGSIILVNLATEGAKVSPDNAKLFATLMFSDLWIAAKERGKRDNVKPFYVYLDEFQEFITPTISKNLDQARGFGLHLTMANQFPLQLIDENENGRRVFTSVMENASSKVAFRLSYEENLRMMAQWLFMGVMDPEQIKHELYSTKVMSYREELKEVISESRSSGQSRGSQRGLAGGAGIGGTAGFFDGVETLSTSESQSVFQSESESESDSWSESVSESRSLVPTLIPVFGKELSHVQFRSLDEQLFRAMAVLFDQKQRQGVARLVGMNAPVSIYTPTVEKTPASKERTQKFLERCYEKLPFAMPRAKAQKQLAETAASFSTKHLDEFIAAPPSVKRRIR
ncbi:MAG: type IV secretion system DNA-binding domain-containing protein [Patescibacteria group bacterium]